ncbi:recombinase RecA [Mesomycoplasma ovipneumoniae]|uniref:Protein RecA n=1 Tax=Mesomycoplasma ovipneumoniae TaxID=29562 RepID=A0AAJ2P548_9BACT|nr:recombinase RecA [Mesomycoplasma ovipneumoniae]MDW2829509.1 recombinase RecA [Mesomycoplasma ovipneumoniae]MDW2834657.1 recombinase RecA [Mesomycoplasma ovipneumoniae]MDW2835413.1 recombinase RecA [Mesomycoplasma ovipneumoniae]MDW2852687.1 recombinase RecA [Mesomycoplasma ovipneumoniae]MDW2860731.1 recombinase RecA [Mesomycoplasma ovipneumoniae]
MTEINDKSLLKQALSDIKKKFGNESIMVLGEKPPIDTEVFSSGSMAIDMALGIGGFPKGRIIEIYGPESSGKTTITLHAIAEVQKRGGIAAFIDAEHSIDSQYAKNLGIDIDNLILSQPDSGEQALDIVDTLAKTKAIDLIVVDSVAALVPMAELQGEMKDQVIGAQARLMSKALRKITASLNKNGTTVIFINQIREKVGVIFGNPETTPGGRGLKFYASIRLDVRKVQQISTGNDITGHSVKIKVVKNKLAIPFKTALVEIVFAKGISKSAELIHLGEELGVLTRKGSWFAYKGENIAQGKMNLKLLLENNEKLFNEIKEEITEKLNENQKENVEI